MIRSVRIHGVVAVAVLLVPGLPGVESVRMARAEPWRQYASPEEAGFDAGQLERVRKLANNASSSAVMVVYRGNVVAAWGDVEYVHDCHSVRKSLVSALVGVFVGKGMIDTQKTLAELGIDDDPPLTAEEKTARVIDLLRARSGVYHPAAKEPDDMSTSRPERGSHKSGEHFWYNNWDFNTVGVILEKQTGRKLFETFKERIADPIGMEDFDVDDGFLDYSPRKSVHPAHAFRISARDLARIGWLFAEKGAWNGEQIVPASWVEESTSVHSPDERGSGYGLMWWSYPKGCFGTDTRYKTLDKYGKFSAQGTGGQLLLVVPEAEFVFVHRADTENGRHVGGSTAWNMSERVLAARTEDANDSPTFTALTAVPFPDAPPRPEKPAELDVDPSILAKYVGVYTGEPNQHLTVYLFEDRLFGEMRGEGDAELIASSPTDFFVRMAPVTLSFDSDAVGNVTHVRVTNQGRTGRLDKVE